MDHPLLIAAQLHGAVELLFDIGQGRLRIGGGMVGEMSLANGLDDAVQIVVDGVTEKVALLDLSQLQGTDVEVIFSRRMAAEDFLPGGFQNQIHLGDPHIGNPINVNLNIGHQPLEVFVCGNLTQQPVVDFPTAQ